MRFLRISPSTGMCLCMRSDMHIAVPGRILKAVFHAAKQIEFWNKPIQDFILNNIFLRILPSTGMCLCIWSDMHIAVPGRILRVIFHAAKQIEF